MNRKMTRSLAAVCTAAALCLPLSAIPSIPAFTPDTASAVTLYFGKPITSGDCSGLHYDDEVAEVQLYYTVNNNGAVITGCKTTHDSTYLLIPKQLGGKNVVAVAAEAFKDQVNITRIEFSGSDEPLYFPYNYNGQVRYARNDFVGGSAVSEFGESAFEGCNRLVKVFVGSNELKVGDYAFYGCSRLSDVDFYDSTGCTGQHEFSTIGKYAFSCCGFGTLNNLNCTIIGNNAFESCPKLTSVNVSAGSIGKNAFNECTALTKINVNAQTVGARCFQKCYELKTVSITADSIGEYCFSRSKKVKTASLDVVDIGAYAFSKCDGLSELYLYNTKKIHDNAFEYCGELEIVNFPKSVEVIGAFAFYKDVKLSNPLYFFRENGEKLDIYRAAFNTSGVEYLVLKGDNISVHDYAFFQCPMKAAVLEGDIDIDLYGLGMIDRENVAPGFVMYGDADSNQFAEEYGIPYVQGVCSDPYNKIMEENKRLFNGVRHFENDNGSCAGVSIMQMMAATNTIDLSGILPEGQSIIDVPVNAWVDHLPEYSEFSDMVNEFQSNQLEKYMTLNSRFFPTGDNFKGYAKLTEYGISVPSVIRVNSHRHAMACFGLVRLPEPVSFKDAISNPEQTYDYAFIVCENGYMFKFDENQHLIAQGYDNCTNDKWIDVEDTFIFVDSKTGRCYHQRYDHVDNYADDYSVTTLNGLYFYPGAAVCRQ